MSGYTSDGEAVNQVVSEEALFPVKQILQMFRFHYKYKSTKAINVYIWCHIHRQTDLTNDVLLNKTGRHKTLVMKTEEEPTIERKQQSGIQTGGQGRQTNGRMAEWTEKTIGNVAVAVVCLLLEEEKIKNTSRIKKNP